MIYRTLMKLTAADLIDLQRLTEAWETYPVLWQSSGVAPAIGNGTMIGRKMSVGKNRWNLIHIVFGSTTTFGTGDYQWTLSDTSAISDIVGGAMYIADTGTASRSAVTVITTGGGVVKGVTSADTLVGATVPQTFAATDRISALVQFEVA